MSKGNPKREVDIGKAMILETKGISKDFGKLSALVNVDMAIEQGEIFGIAGPNGAGKSTFFNVIAGVYPPTTGKIHFDGHDITGLSPHKICHMGISRTFQVPITFNGLTVYDNIRVGATFGGGRARQIQQKVESIMTFLQLEEYENTLASNLDLYTTKVVMLGAALATGCRLLMLDEPLAGLSTVEINRFLNVVRKVNLEDGLPILMIEHILDSLIEISSRLLILHSGEVIYLGTPGGIRSDQKVVEVYLGGGEDET